MSGENFRLVRIANRIRMIDIARELGFKSRSPIHLIEKRLAVPKKFEVKLWELVGIHITNENDYRDYVRHCKAILTIDNSQTT